MKEVHQIFDLVRLENISESGHSCTPIVNLMFDLLFFQALADGAQIWPKVPAVAIVVALACSLPRSSTPIVYAYSSKSKDSGATLFHEKGCEHCHGVNGRGGDLGPDLSTVGKRLKKQQIEHQIHDGGAAMPAFKKWER